MSQKKRGVFNIHNDVEDALQQMKVCAIKAPGFGENRKANLEDLVVLTGGEVISEDRGLTLEKVQLETLGTAKKVTVFVNDTIILNGGGDKKLIEERCEEKSSGLDCCSIRKGMN